MNKNVYVVDKIMTMVFHGIAYFFLIVFAAMAIYLFIEGFAPRNIGLIFSTEGIFNQLFNTVYLVFLALLIGVPFGVVAGTYLGVYAKEGPFATGIRIALETLSSLPSIVVGLFGYLVFIILTGSHWNLFAGALTLSILNVPLIATTTEDAFKSLSKDLARASYGLGATTLQTVLKVLLPAAIPGIMTGIILAAGRAFGEAAALLYTAGMSTDINWSSMDITSPLNPFNPFRPGETLALQIWASRTEALAPNAADVANVSAALLLVLVFVFTMTSRWWSNYMHKKMRGK